MGRKLDLSMDEICKKYLAGMSTYQLAKEYNCSYTTINTKLRDNNIEIRSFSESHIGKNTGGDHPRYVDLPVDEICEKYLSGITPRQLAEEYKCAHKTIINRLRDNNIEIRSSSESHIGKNVGRDNPSYIELPIDDICEKFLSGVSTCKIAEGYGCSGKVITRRLYDNGIDVVKESYKHHSATLQGISYKEWNGHSVEKKYCSLFNERFKEKIRMLYNRRCFLCGKPEKDNGRKLSIHHVNYDKECLCGAPCEFIPLCDSCHSRTNGNRRYWEDLIMGYLYPERYFMIDL